MSGVEPIDAIHQNLTAFFLGGLCVGAFIGSVATRMFAANRATYLFRSRRPS